MGKVIVPQFVADWFEQQKDLDLDNLELVLTYNGNFHIMNWVAYVGIENAIKIIHQMKSTGYKTEFVEVEVINLVSEKDLTN